MRIAFINASYPAMPCGVGDYAAQLASAAADAGHQVTVFTSADPRVRTPPAPPVQPLFEDWTVTEFLRHYRRIRAARPDTVVLQYPSVLPGPHSRLLFALPGLVRALLPQTRVLLVVHEYAQTHDAARRQLGLAFAFAHDIVAVNPADLAAIRANHPRLGARARLGTIGSNISRADAPPEPSGPALFFFGLLHGPYKGFDDLLDALATLDPAIELHVAGTLDVAIPYHREVRKRIDALGLGDRVRWLGYLEAEALSRRLQAAELVVLPFTEGAAANRGTVAAALRNGAALVTTTGPETPEHLRDGDNAVLLAPRDPAALAGAVARLLRDDAARRRLRQGALAIASRYDWPEVVTDTLGPAVHPPDGPWPADGLEAVPACPVCGTRERQLLYSGLRDRVSFVAPGRWTLYACGGCGAAYPDPRPSPGTIGLAYRSYHTHAQPAPAHEAPPGRLGRLRWALSNGYLNARYGYDFEPATRLGLPVASLLPKRRWLADMRVRHLERPTARPRLLDVGCGNGTFLRDMRDAGWDVAGIDPDPAAVETARGTGAEVLEGLLTPGLFAPESFDAVTLSHVVEHLPGPETLAVCHDVLKPGGILWIATPNLESAGHRRFRSAWRGLEPPRHLAIFTRGALTALLERLGFEVVATPRNYMAPFFYRASHAIAEHRDPNQALEAGPRHVERGARIAGWQTLLSARNAEELMVIARKPGRRVSAPA